MLARSPFLENNRVKGRRPKWGQEVRDGQLQNGHLIYLTKRLLCVRHYARHGGNKAGSSSPAPRASSVCRREAGREMNKYNLELLYSNHALGLPIA